ncbi:MAG: FKBP-type peptidyl-prolyl cis-trans isomerase [Sumerlaeia bacterium]
MFNKPLVAALSGLSLVLSSAVLVAQTSETQPAAASQAVETAQDTGMSMKQTVGEKFSYIMGFQMSEQLKTLGLELDEKSFAAGKNASAAGEEFGFSDEEMGQLQADLQQLAEEAQAVAGAENSQKAEAFLAENKTKEGVITTESGLQYIVETAGEGDSPTATSNVVVHYRGALLDGTVFDSSYDRGEPIEFNAGQVIPGWTEGLQLMKPGAKFKFFIPPALGYGERGSMPAIPSNSMLIFDVELIEVQ